MKRSMFASVMLALTLILGLLIGCGGDGGTNNNVSTNGGNGPPTNIIPIPTTSRNADIALTNTVEVATQATLTVAAGSQPPVANATETVPAVTTELARPNATTDTMMMPDATQTTAP